MKSGVGARFQKVVAEPESAMAENSE